MATHPAVTPISTLQQSEASSPAQSLETPHTFRGKYLYAFSAQASVMHYIRTQCAQEERDRLPEILNQWQAVQSRVATLGMVDPLPAGVATTNVPAEYAGVVERYTSDPLFQRSFSALPSTIQVVDIDNVVAAQRVVNLDYVERLVQRLGSDPSFDAILALCVAPQRELDAVHHLEVAPNSHVFSSRNSDVRYLGSYMMDGLTEEVATLARGGGIPVAAVISFIGYGTAAISAFLVNGRCVLNNGFHRAYALRSLGITRIPVVVQAMASPMFEFPNELLGVPREYLLSAPRPAVIKDFFDEGLNLTLDMRERIRALTVVVGNNVGSMDVPV